MTTFIVALVSAAVAVAAVGFELLLGGAGLLAPSAGLVMTVLIGRRAPAERTRVVAVVAGCVASATIEGGVFLIPVIYLLLGHLASIVRRVVPMETVAVLCLWGVALAAMEAAMLLALRLPGRLNMMADGATPWLWAAGGLLATGISFTAAEVIVANVPRLKHAIERP